MAVIDPCGTHHRQLRAAGPRAPAGLSIGLLLSLHKGLEEAAQLLGRWSPFTSKQSFESFQAFLLQTLLLFTELLCLLLWGKSEVKNVDPLPQAGETQDQLKVPPLPRSTASASPRHFLVPEYPKGISYLPSAQSPGLPAPPPSASGLPGVHDRVSVDGPPESGIWGGSEQGPGLQRWGTAPGGTGTPPLQR